MYVCMYVCMYVGMYACMYMSVAIVALVSATADRNPGGDNHFDHAFLYEGVGSANCSLCLHRLSAETCGMLHPGLNSTSGLKERHQCFIEDRVGRQDLTLASSLSVQGCRLRYSGVKTLGLYDFWLHQDMCLLCRSWHTNLT